MKPFLCLCICLLSSLLAITQTAAQTYSISGLVTDNVSNKGLDGVTVTIANQTATTDATGSYTLTNVPPGPQIITASLTHYTIANRNITVADNMANQDLVGTGDSKKLALSALKARKDTTMLCLAGCKRTGNNAWNKSRATAANYGLHDGGYCVYTAVATINRFYGGTVTEDECAYNAHNGPTPDQNELGHDMIGADFQQAGNALKYALSPQQGTIQDFISEPTEAQYQFYIDSNTPLFWTCSWIGQDIGHAMVISGYRYVDKSLQLYFLNTDNNGREEWIGRYFEGTNETEKRYWKFGSTAYPLNASWQTTRVPPANSKGRAKDSRLSQDSDGDGINDFDEIMRWSVLENPILQAGKFAGLDPHNADTDGDGLPDGIELEGRLFRGGNDPKLPGKPDTDSDGVRDEFDTDSDNDGIKDGYEDINGNANVDPGETDPYTSNAIGVNIALNPSVAKNKIYVNQNTTVATFIFYHADGTTAWPTDAIEPTSLKVTVTINSGQAIPLTLQRTGTGTTATWTATVTIPAQASGKAVFNIKNSYGDANILAGKEFIIDLRSDVIGNQKVN